MPGAMSALRNTVVIAFFKIVLGLVVPITVAILLNEVRSSKFRRTVQTVSYTHLVNFLKKSGSLEARLSLWEKGKMYLTCLLYTSRCV